MEPDVNDEFDWTRLAELQRRNASCLPHLLTSYPVETQMGQIRGCPQYRKDVLGYFNSQTLQHPEAEIRRECSQNKKQRWFKSEVVKVAQPRGGPIRSEDISLASH